MIWFSRHVPLEYRHLEERPQIQFSLGTPDVDEARRLARAHAAKQDARWRGEAAPQVPAMDALAIAVQVAVDDFYGALLMKRASWPRDGAAYGQKLAETAAQGAVYERDRQEKRLDRWEQLADRIISNRQIPVDKGSETYREIVEVLAEGSVNAIRKFVAASRGEPDVHRETDGIAAIRQQVERVAKPGETLDELYSLYSAFRSEPGRARRRRPESMKHDKSHVDLFAEFVGHDRAVATITAADAKAFKSLLGKIPANRSKVAALAGLSIEESINVTKRDGLPRLSLITQQKYLSIISPFMRWIVSETDLGLTADPFAGLHHDIEKGSNRRPSYKTSQLNAILASPLFNLCRGAGREHIAGTIAVRDWHYWIPLLCLFTGTRVTEIAQLYVDDVVTEDGVMIASLEHDEAAGQMIKNRKRRIVALHPYLKDAGFLEYVSVQRDRAEQDGNRQLFPELTAGSRRLLGEIPSSWWGKYLTRIGIKNGKDGLGTHSFRHTMADAMRKAGYMDVVFGQLVLGHSNQSITAGYGDQVQGVPARLLNMIEEAFRSEPFKQVDFSSIRSGSGGSKKETYG